MAGQIVKLTHEEIKSGRPDREELKGLQRLPVSVIAENIRSLYNVGSLFRTSDGAGVEMLYLTGYSGYPPRKEIDKTALGSVESVPWTRCPNTFEALYSLRARGYQVVSLEHTDRSVPYTEAEYRFPLCLVVGNEVSGVTPEIVALSDLSVEIPMFGLKQSLNVSVAYGILVYHLVQEYKKVTLSN